MTDIFDSEKSFHDGVGQAFELQRKKKIGNYDDFCTLLVNNYLREMAKLVENKLPQDFARITSDRTLVQYYLFSAVFVGSLIRLLRHFFVSAGKPTFPEKVARAIKKGRSPQVTFKKNMENRQLQRLFRSPLKSVVKKSKFTVTEFERMGWRPNTWSKIEADLFYKIRNDNHPRFGKEELLFSKYRKQS